MASEAALRKDAWHGCSTEGRTRSTRSVASPPVLSWPSGGARSSGTGRGRPHHRDRAPPAPRRRGAAARAEPVTVGFISPMTGFVAALGHGHEATAGTCTGSSTATRSAASPSKTVYEDDAGDPEVALTKAKRLVEQEAVDMTAGPILANTAYAVAELRRRPGRPARSTSGRRRLTQRQVDPLVMRVGLHQQPVELPRRTVGVRPGLQERGDPVPRLRLRLGRAAAAS